MLPLLSPLATSLSTTIHNALLFQLCNSRAASWYAPDESITSLSENSGFHKADKNHTHTVVNGHTVESDVPVGAKFTDTTYSVATHSKDGLMSSEDKVKIDNINNIIINDNTISNEQTYSSKKINTDYYNKNQVDNIFLQVGWTGTLEQYNTMLIHNPGMVYTTVDNKGNIKRFLGDIELKNDTIIIGKAIQVLYGISDHKFGNMIIGDGN